MGTVEVQFLYDTFITKRIVRNNFWHLNARYKCFLSLVAVEIKVSEKIRNH